MGFDLVVMIGTDKTDAFLKPPYVNVILIVEPPSQPESKLPFWWSGEKR